MVLDHIDIIYFINLDRRPDRLAEITGELAKINTPAEKIIRVSGMDHQFGIYGCAMSHIAAIEHFIASGKNKCMIFEDDFEWTQPKEIVESVMSHVLGTYPEIGCLVISGLIHNMLDTNDPLVKKPTYVATCAGYSITRKFAPSLLANFKESAELQQKSILETGGPHEGYNHDCWWYRLQVDSGSFFITNPLLGRQRLSYSDITNVSSVTVSNIFLRNADLSMEYLRAQYRDF